MSSDRKATESSMTEIFENFLRQNYIQSLFGNRRRKPSEDADAPTPIPQLSPFANSVVSRCSRILRLSTEELQQSFEAELPAQSAQGSTYARNLLEYCCYRALHVLIKRVDHLSGKDFRRLTFDMMLAWEYPGTGSESSPKGTASRSNSKVEEGEDGGSLFYTNSTSMAVQVDDKKTIGAEAFARIAPASPAIADTITVYNLFDVLTSSSGGQLHFLIYDKYLKSLDKVLKSARSIIGPSLASSLQLADGEIILDVDGAVPTQPVLKHIGISAWPGRLTLTNYAIYFEPLGVGSYDRAVSYDLATDLKQVIKRELTGPLGARLFDKAVMYKSNSQTEPICFEFPEFKGHSRRDYWLAIIREVLQVHRFIRKFDLKEVQQQEALSKAALGIFRYRAVKDVFHVTPSHYKSTLAFNLAEKLPKGDVILESLYKCLELLNTRLQVQDVDTSSSGKKLQPCIVPVSSYTLSRMGFFSLKMEDMVEERDFIGSDICAGVTSPLEMAVKESLCHSGTVEAARATVDQVKVEGIDTNIAVMQGLLFPLIEASKWLWFLAGWEDPFKSTLFMLSVLFVFYRGWFMYILPSIFLSVAVLMVWHKLRRKGKPLEAFQVASPPSKNAVEQIMILQEGISQLETHVQALNIVLLKIRALLFAATPQATNNVVLACIVAAVVVTFVPLRYLMMLVLLEVYTREMPLRKRSSDKIERRLREWWVRVPAAPVQLIKADETKKRK